MKKCTYCPFIIPPNIGVLRLKTAGTFSRYVESCNVGTDLRARLEFVSPTLLSEYFHGRESIKEIHTLTPLLIKITGFILRTRGWGQTAHICLSGLDNDKIIRHVPTKMNRPEAFKENSHRDDSRSRMSLVAPFYGSIEHASSLLHRTPKQLQLGWGMPHFHSICDIRVSFRRTPIDRGKAAFSMDGENSFKIYPENNKSLHSP